MKRPSKPNPYTYRRTTTRIIENGVIVVAKKKTKRPLDPAEIQRRNAEQRAKERESRRFPGSWGVNDEALKQQQNENVVHEAETRTKTARIYRYDAFGILFSRGGLGEGEEAGARLTAVRRFEAALAQRMRLEGTTGQGAGAGRPIPISDRSLLASKELDAIEAAMTPFLHALLVKLVIPSVERGQPVNNWRKVVQDHAGEHRHTVQASHVRACAENLLGAWQAWDNRERRAA